MNVEPMRKAADKEFPGFWGFMGAYVEALFWADTGEVGQPDSEAELSPVLEALTYSECLAFWLRWRAVAEETDATPEQMGHDFYLTRCGHGTGFRDRGALYRCEGTETDFAPALTTAAEAAGPVELYIGEDGLIYA